MTIQRPRGTRDFLPDDTFRRNTARKAMQDVLEKWGYQEISTPTFENLDLFTIKSGQSILEEIYNFEDKGGRNLALRPELTAPVMRMYVNELQNAPKPLRLHYFGNCFRYERPQRGRFREFWQLGAELIGSDKPDSEAEIIALAQELLKSGSVNVSGELHVGHLGLIRLMMGMIPPEERTAIMKFIDKKEHQLLTERLDEIGADNLGLLDLIDLKGRGALDKALDLTEDLLSQGDHPVFEETTSSTTESQEGRSARTDRIASEDLGLDQFQELVDLLDCYGVDAIVDFEIVRGLEYYTGTVFEIYTTGLGAQNQICGGGTYQLASLLGGRNVRSTGFGIGFDRIMEVAKVKETRPSPVAVVFMSEVKAAAIKAAKELRNSFPVVLDVMDRSIGAQLKYASNIGASHAVIIGPREVKEGLFTLRNMESGVQESLTLEDLEDKLIREQAQK
ncbi:MAG: histidine--tRNA ligase [Methanotrichaceae archaeon]